jgi:hypothetical protein
MTDLALNLRQNRAGLFWSTESTANFTERWEDLTSEAEIQKQIIKELLAENCLVIRINSGKLGDKVAFNRWAVPNVEWSTAGVCDLIAVYPDGEVKFIECKKYLGRTTDEQKRFLEELKKRARKGKWVRVDEPGE